MGDPSRFPPQVSWLGQIPRKESARGPLKSVGIPNGMLRKNPEVAKSNTDKPQSIALLSADQVVAPDRRVSGRGWTKEVPNWEQARQNGVYARSVTSVNKRLLCESFR